MNYDLARKRFKEKRRSLGLSIRDMEPIIGVSFATISRFERGESDPNEDTLNRIVDWIVNNVESPKREKKAKSPWYSILERVERIEKHLGIGGSDV